MFGNYKQGRLRGVGRYLVMVGQKLGEKKPVRKHGSCAERVAKRGVWGFSPWNFLHFSSSEIASDAF